MGLVLIVVIAGWLYVVLAPARQVLRGDDRGSMVPGRAYLAFLLWFVPLAAATMLYVSSSMLFASALRMVALFLLLVAVPCLLLHGALAAFGRPAFLVPPPYRPPHRRAGRPADL
jgi:hypothetical protein